MVRKMPKLEKLFAGSWDSGRATAGRRSTGNRRWPHAGRISSWQDAGREIGERL